MATETTVKGLNVKFGADTVSFDNSVKGINKAIGVLGNELKSLNKQLKLDPTNIDLLDRKFKNLQQTEDLTKKKLEQLRSEMSELNQEEIGGDKWVKLTNQINKTEAELAQIQSESKKTELAINDIGDKGAKSLNDLDKKAEQASKSLSNLSKSSENLGKALTPMSTLAAGVVAGIAGLAVSAGSAADDLNTLSKITGLSTKQLQEFQYASGIIDVELETLATSYSRITRAIGQASEGTGAQAEAFAKLGVEIRNADGTLKSTNDVFDDTIQALGKIENQAERDSTAMELFGKSATQLNPLILGGAEDLKLLSEEAENLGLIIDQDLLDQANEFADSMDKMKATTEAVGLQIGAEFAPIIKEVTDRLILITIEVRNFISSLSPAQKKFIVIFASLLAAVAPLLLIFSKLSGFMGTSFIPMITKLGSSFGLATGQIGLIIGAITILIGLFVSLYNSNEQFRNAVNQLASTIGGVVMTVFTSLSTFFQDTLMPAFKQIIDMALPVIVELFTTLANVLTEVVLPILLQLWTIFAESILPIIIQLVEFFTEFLLPILLQFATFLSEYIIPIIKILFEWFSTYLLPIIKGIADFIATVLTVVFGALGTIIEDVVGFVKGLFEWFGDLWKTLEETWWLQAIVDLFSLLGTIIDGVIGSIRWLIDNIGKVANFIFGGGVSDAANAVKNASSGVTQSGNNMIKSGGFGSISMHTDITVSNNGTPINENIVKEWGRTITDVVSEELGRRGVLDV